MAADKVSALGKELGAELRMRREKAGFNALEFSRRIGWSPTKVSRAETGAKMLAPTEIMMYLASCGTTRDEISKVLALAEEGDKGYRLKDHTDDIYDETRTLIFHERSALTIDSYEPIFVPTLLQTERYTRARLIETGVNYSPIVEHRMQCVLNRQEVLRQSEPPQCTFFIHENALTTLVGDNLIMNEQLLHLVFLTSWHRCVIRLVPRSAKANGQANNGFQRLTFPNQDPMVTIDLETNALILDNKSDTRRYANVLGRLDRAALNAELSRTVIADLANNYDGADMTDVQQPDSRIL
jgi:transcriptional regulator with XRE-family HTH domain